MVHTNAKILFDTIFIQISEPSFDIEQLPHGYSINFEFVFTTATWNSFKPHPYYL